MSNLAYGTFTITNLSTVTSVDVYYYNSTSSTSLSGGSWSTNTPTWTNGKYIWSKTVTTWEQGVTTESKPVCITGQKGSTGAAGQSVTKITQQYALGTSSTTAPTSGWSTAMPAFESGKFYWTRSEIVWTNPSSTTYTTAVLANGITSANNNAEVAKTDAASAVSTANTANQTANTANQTANAANQTAQNAVSIANGKNTIYYSSSKPTGGTYKAGDTWFNLTTDGYRLYEYDATAKDWVQKSMDGKSITAGTVTAAQIHAGAITTDKLATNAIKSANYNAGTAPYSLTGTFLDLSNGNIFTPNFGVNNDSTDSIDNGAYIKGTIQAYDGKIGSDNNNYWYIGNYFDYNQGQSAMIRSHGTAAIQLGDSSTWRLSTNRIHTAWNDDSTSGEAFRLHYPSYGGKYWDSGLHVPASATDKLLYIRNAATSTSLEILQNDIDDNSGGNYWKYQFYLTNDGSLYAKNIYIMDDNGGTTQIGGTDGVYLLKSGGTISGNLEITGTLKMQGNFLNKSGSAITLQTNLASTSAATLTGNSSSPIKLGVTGTLPVANGGTGNTNYTSGGIVYVSNTNPKTLLSNAAGTSGQLLASGGSGVPTWVNASSLTVAAATKATQDGNGKVIATTYLPLTGGNVTGPVNFGDSVSIDDLTAGTLVITGNSSFTNNAQFNTINGVTVGSSPKFTDTTYTFDGTYNASSNKAATVSTVTNAINALDVNAIAGATNKTLTSISETNGKISATYSNISITKSQISDFPTSMPASDVSAWAKASTKPTYKQDEILPLQSKTFTNVIGTANSWAGATFFYGSIKPATWGEIWRIKYRIKVFVPGQPNYNQMADVMVSGRAGDLKSYASLNTIGGYYVCYYHVLYRMKEAGFNNGYGHSLGVRFYSAYNPTDTNYKRTIDVEILETENCTFNFYDNCLLYADIPGTGSTNYNNFSEMNFVDNGLQETGDSNDPNYYNRTYYTSRTTSAALYRYQFCLTKSDGTLIPVNSVNNSVATNKTLTTDSFDPFGDIFFWSSTSTYAANANVGNSSLFRQYLADLRYSFNCGGYDTTPTLTARAPLYLVATPQTDGTAKLYTQPLSMELPTSADGLIYIYLGRVYEDTKPYRVVLSPKHPVYEYRNGAVRTYTGLKSEAAASGGTNVSLVTTGQKYLWNNKTNNTGTVTSVAASGSGGITISGSPITTSGTLAIGLNLSTAINGLGEGSSPANRNDYIVAQYAGGGTTTTTYHRRKLSNIFAALIADDIPDLAWSKITSGNDDLKAIEALTGTSGFLKKTAANTWTLDTNTYLTGITSSQVTTALGYTPYNATNPNGYTTNTGTVTKVTAGTGLKIGTASSGGDITTTGIINHINSVTAQTTQGLYPIKIDAQGHISAYGSAVTTWALSNITGADDLKAIEALSGTSGFLKKTATNTWSLDTTSYVPTTRKVNGHVLSSDVTVTKGDVGLGNVTNYQQITGIGQGANGTLRVWTGDPTSTSTDDYTDVTITITAYDQSTVKKAVALDLKAAVGSTSKPVYFKADGKPYEIGYTIEKSVPSNAVFTDTTYTFDGTYNASTNKAATVSTVTNAINALDGNLNSTTPGVGKTLTAFSQTNGKISATFGDISITKSQISDFPSALTPTAHTHGNISNIGTITSTAIALGEGDNLLFADSSNSGKIERSSITIGTGTTKYLRQDGTWGIPVNTTYTFDGAYNASTNKAATVSTVTNAINALDGGTIGTGGQGKTITSLSQSNGNVSATFADISITKSQISDFPTSLTPTSHTHGNIQNGGTLQTNDITIANGDKLVVTDSSDSSKIARSSVSFDGSTKTQALTKAGTWETFNNYSLPLAASGTRGGIQIGYSSSGKNYAVQLSSQKAYVNVPWTDTTYSAGTGLSLSGTTFANTGVTGIKGNSESSYRTGQVNLTAANIGAVNLTGDTMTGNLRIPAGRIANTYYGISFGMTGVTPVETILYTGIKWVSSSHMPVIHITGYAYGLSSPVEFKIGFYIYNNNIGWSGVTNMGSWAPNVYLFKYTKNELEYVAVGLAGSCYYLQLSVDVQDERGKFSQINTDSSAWSWSFLTTTGTIPEPDDGTTCIQVPYRANILKPANATHADSVAWSGITNKPTTLSGYGITDSILEWHATTTAATNIYDFGVYVARGAEGATGPTNQNFYAMLNIPYRKAFGNTKADYAWSIAGSTSNDKRLFYRTSGADTWGDWAEVAHINVGTAVGSATQPVYVTNTGVVTACTSYANASVNHATSADSATKVGNSSIWLYANHDNEINFGGTNTSTTIFMGDRATDSRPIPTKFIFGGSTGTADLQTKTVYLGSGTTSYISSTQYTGNAATATKATQDKNGNDITTKYVTMDTTQTITGRKTFSDLAAVTFKPSSGTDKCNINYDATLGALVFSF